MGFSATSGSRLFISIRNGASVSHDFRGQCAPARRANDAVRAARSLNACTLQHHRLPCTMADSSARILRRALPLSPRSDLSVPQWPRCGGVGIDRRRNPRRCRSGAPGARRGPDRHRAARAPDPGRDSDGAEIRGHFNALRGYVAPMRLAGVKVVSDYVDNYRRGLPSEMGLLNLFDPHTGQPGRDHRRRRPHRHAHRRRDGARREAPRPQGQPRARPHRRARHRLLERAPARPAVRLRRDSRALAPARKSRDAFAARLYERSRQAGAWRRTIGNRASRAPTSSSKASRARRARADAQDRLDQASARSSSRTER